MCKKLLSSLSIFFLFFIGLQAQSEDTDISFNTDQLPIEGSKGVALLDDLTINGLVQFQVDHVESQYNGDVRPGGKSEIQFRRLGLLFSKPIYEDILVVLGLDFNTEDKRAEASKGIVQKKFWDVHTIEAGYNEKSFGYEANISNIKAKRIEKSIASRYFRNPIDGFMLGAFNGSKESLHYKAYAGVSKRDVRPRTYYVYTLGYIQSEWNDIVMKHGASLGWLNFPDKQRFLVSIFADWQYGKYNVKAEFYTSRFTDEGKQPFGLHLEQSYQITAEQSIVACYAYLNADGSSFALNPSSLIKFSPENKLGSRKPSFNQMHEIYLGHDWYLRPDIRFMWGYQLGVARTPNPNSSLERNNLHGLHARLQFTF